MPLTKRLNTDQSFLNDVLGLNMISLSYDSQNKNVQGQVTDVGSSFFPAAVHKLNFQNFKSCFEETNGTATISTLRSTNTSVTLKQSTGQHECTVMEIPRSLSVPTVNRYKSSCVWPTGISHQADFFEIVVTDEEMNAYWEKIKDSF
jgi:hypothetical protein